jgi:hypothetical protein
MVFDDLLLYYNIEIDIEILGCGFVGGLLILGTILGVDSDDERPGTQRAHLE